MRILVIEDEKKMAAFLAKGLREAGYTVEIARDGETGIELASATRFDLFLVVRATADKFLSFGANLVVRHDPVALESRSHCAAMSPVDT